ncbi:MAG: succinate dehydrogenase/fumarate reductase cytochrome b subunit, partial [Halieaceae bacterium]|nr:succinate dehydrogenase/fumarate reductase cytochrome b subunit [Halieaceae bacterium]
MDLLQGASGLVLVLFMWVHMFLVSSILLGKDAMYVVTRMLEGEYFFGRAYPALVSGVAIGVLAIFLLHALVAMWKIPGSYREYRVFWQHGRSFSHADTWLWLVQVVTGL